MDLDLLGKELVERDQPAYRAGQVWSWAARGARGYEEMTNLPAALRADLAVSPPTRRWRSSTKHARATAP